MMRGRVFRAVVVAAVSAVVLSGCAGWRGLNSLPLPGVEGVGPGAFTIQAELPDVDNIEPNSRVRVGDVHVGHVTRIERQGWHALVTMELNGAVERCNGAWRYEFYAVHDLPHQIDRLQPFVDAFAHRYNHYRPHDALDGRTPAEYLSQFSTGTSPPSHMS